MSILQETSETNFTEYVKKRGPGKNHHWQCQAVILKADGRLFVIYNDNSLKAYNPPGGIGYIDSVVKSKAWRVMP